MIGQACARPGGGSLDAKSRATLLNLVQVQAGPPAYAAPRRAGETGRFASPPDARTHYSIDVKQLAASRDPAARLRPGDARRYPQDNERAQGRPGAGRTHGCLQTKQASSPQVRPSQPGPPCAMVLRLTPRSPRGTGSFAPVIRAMPAHPRELDASVAAPGPHGLTVRATSFVGAPLTETLAMPRGHRSPHSTYRDDAYAPLHEAGWRERTTFSDKKKEKFYCAMGAPR